MGHDGPETHHKLSVQNMHKWWNRIPKEVLNQQGIEPHPGPNPCGAKDKPQPFHIVSRNIRGLFSNLGNAIRTKADVICLQEADLFESEVGDFSAQALAAG